MDIELHRRLQATTEQLRAHPIPKKASTESTYADKLRANWKPYALQHGLPTTFTPTTPALTTDQIFAFIVASKLGDTRRHTRDGAGLAARQGKPLVPSTLDGVLAALRNSHQTNGLTWAGDETRIRDAVRAYRATSDHTVTRAAPMTPQQLVSIFGTTPSTSSSAAIRARARAVALALEVPLAALPSLGPAAVTVIADRVEVALSGGVVRVARCLRTRLDDPIATAACAHCQLRTWLQADHPEPLIDERDSARFRSSTKAAASHLLRADVDGDVLTVVDDDLWATIALGLDPECARWLRMRAALLPMFVSGLRLDDIDGLNADDVAFTQNVTLSIAGKTEPGSRPHIITLVPEGGPLCPVAAMHSYDSWVRAYLPERDAWTPPLRGQLIARPWDTARPAGSRALYQSTRIWLLERGIDIDAAVGTRTSLTPQSSRRGFAQEAEGNGASTEQISEAMRHKRPDTTAKYLARATTATATRLIETLGGEAR